MYKAWNRVENKLVTGTWEDVCDLDKRWWEVSEYLVDADGEEIIPKPTLLTTLTAKTIKGGTRNINVYGIGDTDGIYLGPK